MRTLRNNFPHARNNSRSVSRAESKTAPTSPGVKCVSKDAHAAPLSARNHYRGSKPSKIHGVNIVRKWVVPKERDVGRGYPGGQIAFKATLRPHWKFGSRWSFYETISWRDERERESERSFSYVGIRGGGDKPCTYIITIYAP